MSILDQNMVLSGQEIFNEGNIIIYQPTNDQKEQLIKILQENSTVSFENGVQMNAQLDIFIVKTLLIELTNLREEVLSLSDEELSFKLNNGNKTIKNMIRKLKDLLSELSEDILNQSLDMIDNFDSLLRTSTSMTKMEKTLNKLGLTIADIQALSNGDTSVLEKMNKTNQSKKKTQPKSKPKSKNQSK